MKIEMKEITIREVVDKYIDKKDEGVTGYGGLLNIRPKYQREFVYGEEQSQSVINSIRNNFPINVMYWVKNVDGTLEVLDGQQRIISICQYVSSELIFKEQYFHNLTQGEKDLILDYKLMIYFCEGTDKEKLDWFKIINIAGEKLTEQELRNAVYTGPWLTDAKRYFSKNGCVAFNLGKEYLNGSPIRQDYLETVLKWISNDDILTYMAKNQLSSSANNLWLYFQNVINWVKAVYPHYRKEMKGVNWGELYNDFNLKSFDSIILEQETQRLMKDEDVTKKSGIYYYLFTKKEKYLSIRAFTDNHKRESFERQKGICPNCTNTFKFEEMEGDHITPWHLGGKTNALNCQMLCKDCNRKKTGK